MLYPQNGDRIVAVDVVTSFHPVYSVKKQGTPRQYILSVNAIQKV